MRVHDITLAPMPRASVCRCCIEEIDGPNCTNAVFDDYKNYSHMFAADDDLCHYCNFSLADASTKQLSDVAVLSTCTVYRCSRSSADVSCSDPSKFVYADNVLLYSLARTVSAYGVVLCNQTLCSNTSSATSSG